MSETTYRHLEKELGGSLEIQWGGSLTWAGDSEYGHELRSRAHEHQKWDYAIRLVDREELQRLEPNVEPGPVVATSYSALEGSVDPEESNRLLVEKAREAGARVEYPCEVTDLNLRSGRLRGIETTCGEFEADVLVIACGVDTPRLAEKAGIKVPLVDSPGLLAHTKSSSRLLYRIVRSLGLEMRQKMSGGIVTGAGYGRGPRVTEASLEAGERALKKASAFHN